MKNILLGGVMTLVLLLANSVTALASPNPAGQANSWIQGQMLELFEIALMVGIIVLVFTKKMTGALSWLILLVAAAIIIGNATGVFNLLRSIGNILL